MAAPVTTTRSTFQTIGIGEGRHTLQLMSINQSCTHTLLLRSYDQDLVMWLSLAARESGNIASSWVAIDQLNFGHAINKGLIKGRRREGILGMTTASGFLAYYAAFYRKFFLRL